MTENNGSTNTPRRGGLVAGAVLVLVGVVSLLANVLQPSGSLFLGLISAAFIVFGLGFRKNGLLIPGGILAGIATGTYLIEGPFRAVADPARGGFFLLAFAGGFILVSLLSAVNGALGATGCRWMWWPLIPAGVLAITGGMLITENLRALELLGQGWPIVLIAIGLYLLLRRNEMRA